MIDRGSGEHCCGRAGRELVAVEHRVAVVGAVVVVAAGVVLLPDCSHLEVECNEAEAAARAHWQGSASKIP